MPKVIYKTASGDVHETELREGQSVMEGAIRNGVPGILAECGGSCMCATCHVYIVSGPTDLLPEMSEDEDAMLEESIGERKSNSRLSCQLRMTGALDGLCVEVAENM